MTVPPSNGTPVGPFDVAVWLRFCEPDADPDKARSARRKVMRLRHDGVIPGVEVGREWRFWLSDVERALRLKAWASVRQTEGQGGSDVPQGGFPAEVTPGGNP